MVAHLGMSEYHAFADLAEAYDGVHLDTTMAGTDFTERFAAAARRLRRRGSRHLRAKVVLGSDFPNIPYAYAHQLEALDRLGLGDDWMRAVLWENGARLHGRSPRDARCVQGVTREGTDQASDHCPARFVP